MAAYTGWRSSPESGDGYATTGRSPCEHRGAPRRFAALPKFGNDRSEADQTVGELRKVTASHTRWGASRATWGARPLRLVGGTLHHPLDDKAAMSDAASPICLDVQKWRASIPKEVLAFAQ